MIATDLDGTLLQSDHTISERTYGVLAQARASGVTIVAATGRGPRALPAFEPSGIIELAVCSNGAAVVDLTSGTIVERSDLTGHAVRTIFSEVEAALPGACFAWETETGFGWDQAFADHGQILIDSYAVRGSLDLDPASAVSKAFIAHNELGYAALARRTSEIISVEAEITSAGLPFVAITAANVTKASTLSRLCARIGIDRSEVVAFGDSWNDLEMLAWAGLGVAMENANDDVKRMADVVAGPHDRDGVADFIANLLDLPPKPGP